MQHVRTPPHRPTSHVHVFAYGSNLFPDRMVERVPSARVVGLASLPEHTLEFHMRSTDGSGKADAHFTGRGKDRVEGCLYRLDERHLEALDRIESGYRRCLHHFRLQVERGAREIRAWAYHARPERIRPGLRPFTWYHRYVVEGARRQGIAQTYVERLARLEAVADPIGEAERLLAAVG